MFVQIYGQSDPLLGLCTCTAYTINGTDTLASITRFLYFQSNWTEFEPLLKN